MLRREPVYEGFSKVGERLLCVSCGHEFAGEENVPFKDVARPKLFGEADRSAKVVIFSSDDDLRNCRHCAHYVVNPFVQRCNLHQREVDAMDLCDQFKEPTSGGKPDQAPKDPLSKLFG
jgi:hypothetical protein